MLIPVLIQGTGLKSNLWKALDITKFENSVNLLSDQKKDQWITCSTTRSNSQKRSRIFEIKCGICQISCVGYTNHGSKEHIVAAK